MFVIKMSKIIEHIKKEEMKSIMKIQATTLKAIRDFIPP